MSLFGALLTGVSGLQAQSQALNITSSNIANVDTVGYKASDTDFATVLASTIAGDNTQTGVQATTSQNVTQQGTRRRQRRRPILPSTATVSSSPARRPARPTRSFTTRVPETSRPDSNGNLVNGSGDYLLGYPSNDECRDRGDDDCEHTDPGEHRKSFGQGRSLDFDHRSQANLQSSSTVDATYVAGDMANNVVTPDFTRTIDVYDSQGGTQPLSFSFVKTAANTWAYEVSYEGNGANISPSTNPIATGTMTFNSDGTLANANSPASATSPERSRSQFHGPARPAWPRRRYPSIWEPWVRRTASRNSTAPPH